MTDLGCDGVGLRSGQRCRVALHRRPGPFAFRVDGVDVPLRSLTLAQSERTTTVQVGASTIATVEHLLAACAAKGLHEGLLVEVFGGEVPLLDGGARSIMAALGPMAAPRVPPPLVVRRAATIIAGASRYEFVDNGGGACRVSVEISFDDVRIGRHAAWDGTEEDFARISSARTFAFADEVPELARKGLASHVDRASVLVFTADAVLCHGAPFTADEPARHKLLDLMGDLFLYGGPPRGEVRAFRPGHAVTHDIMRIALETGVVTHDAVVP